MSHFSDTPDGCPSSHDSPSDDSRRCGEMLAIQHRLEGYSMHFFTLGDIRFLDRQIKAVDDLGLLCCFSEEDLTRARAIERSCIKKSEEFAGISRDLETLAKDLEAARTRRNSHHRKV